MIAIKRGKILRKIFARKDIQGYIVSVDGREARCIVYPDLIGEVLLGDEVLLNTTALELVVIITLWLTYGPKIGR